MARAVTCSPTARADHSGTGLRTKDFYPSAARAYRRENPMTAGTFASETSRPVDLSREVEFAKCTVTAWATGTQNLVRVLRRRRAVAPVQRITMSARH